MIRFIVLWSLSIFRLLDIFNQFLQKAEVICFDHDRFNKEP